MKTIILAAAFAATSLSLPGTASAQQADPTQALIAEWQAMRLSQEHAEIAISRVIAAYESRLSTAMEWLKAAQAETKPKQ